MKNTFILSGKVIVTIVCTAGWWACDQRESKSTGVVLPETSDTLKPVVVTEAVAHDSDDPAIWINHNDPAASLIFGTDKSTDGAIYAFDLNGKIVEDKVIHDLKRPNNIDLEYGLMTGSGEIDIIVFTERERNMLRIYSVPDMTPLDNGGFEVFSGETPGDFRAPMGISLYKHPSTGVIYAVVGRKDGPTDSTYLWQYEITYISEGSVNATAVRKFGAYSGANEIEAIAVDDEAGYVYYSDEGTGIRKYYADPAMGNEELALFGMEGFREDHEGIGIWKTGKDSGYLIISDQQAGAIRLYNRSGNHEFIKSISYSAIETDGLDISTFNFGGQWKNGILVAMSGDKTFHYYSPGQLNNLLK